MESSVGFSAREGHDGGSNRWLPPISLLIDRITPGLEAAAWPFTADKVTADGKLEGWKKRATRNASTRKHVIAGRLPARWILFEL